MFLIKIFWKCSAASNKFNNTVQFFYLCFCLCPDIKVWTCFVHISALNFQTQRQRRERQTFHSRGPANLFEGSWLSTSEHSAPSHPHYYTAANPVSQIPAPWTPSRKSYWCCTFLHMLWHIGMLCPPECLCLLQACFPYVFFCKSPHESLHPIHNQHCLMHADSPIPRTTETRTVFSLMPVCCLAVTNLLVYLSLFCLLMEFQLKIHEAVFSFRETWECVSIERYQDGQPDHLHPIWTAYFVINGVTHVLENCVYAWL